MADNSKNLIPMNKRTMEERQKIGSKGGVKSGIVRRKKADLRKAMELILSSEVYGDAAKKQLEVLGLETTNEMALMVALFQKATKGSVRAMEQVIKLAADKDKYDIKEQKERIKQMSLQNKRNVIELDGINPEELDDGFIEALNSAGERVWQDE